MQGFLLRKLHGKAEFKVVTVRDHAELPLEAMGFADAAKLDFGMKAGAPVFQKVPGFQAIPFAKIGLQTNDLRPTIPPREAKFSGRPGG